MKYVPAAVSHRDGHGHVLAVEVATGKIRISVPILTTDDRIVGEVTPEGTAYWDPPFHRLEVRTAPPPFRRALATTGRLTASVDQHGTVVAFRVGLPRSVSTRSASHRAAESRPSYAYTDAEVDHFTRPARIISIEGRPVRRKG